MKNDIHLSFKTTDETNGQLYLRLITFMLDMGEHLPFIKTVYSCSFEPQTKHLPTIVCLKESLVRKLLKNCFSPKYL